MIRSDATIILLNRPPQEEAPNGFQYFQAAVVHVSLLQRAFSTVGLSLGDWLRCAAVASSVLWLREISKSITRF